MTTESRIERRLPEILEELYLGRTPDYRDEVLTAAVRTRQRASWTFLGRWIPMADIASRPAYAPRMPWRTITVAFLIGALLLAVAVAYLGSRQTRLPPPFGLAENGLLTYSADGDIWTTDLVTGDTIAVVTGTDDDSAPIFSPDGTKIAFLRKATVNDSLGQEIVVASADGSNQIVVSRQPAARASTHLEWAPDSRSLLTGVEDLSEILLVEATALAEPRTVVTDADLYSSPYQPPVGDAILIGRATNEGSSMVRLDLATGKETVLATGEPTVSLADARWSPDGTQVVFSSPPVDDQDSRRLFLVNADGSDLRQITSAPGVWWDIAPAWSPDGNRIAFLPYERIATDTWDVRPIVVYSVADGSVTDLGPIPRDIRAAHPAPGDEFASGGEGWSFDWAPDGASLIAFPTEGTGHPVVIDAATGESTTLDAVITPTGASQAWQRTAP